MRLLILCSALALAFAACGGKKTTTKVGDPAVGDPGVPGDPTPGDPPVVTAAPSHVKINSASGTASSPQYKARIRVGGPMPSGAASAAGKTVQGGSPTSP